VCSHLFVVSVVVLCVVRIVVQLCVHTVCFRIVVRTFYSFCSVYVSIIVPELLSHMFVSDLFQICCSHFL
jgi:hypothetical protein